MANYLNYAGLQEYDNLIKEYIGKHGGGFPQLTTDFNLSAVSGNYIVSKEFSSIKFSGTGITTSAISTLFEDLGNNAYPILVSGQSNGVVFSPLGIIGISADFLANEITLPFVGYFINNGSYSRTEFLGKIPSATLLENLKKAEANILEGVQVKTASGTSDLTITSKKVTIDFTPYLKTFVLGSTTKNVANSKIEIDSATLKTEVQSAISTATQSAQGFMSAQDKKNLDTLYALLGATDDADSVVNTINEILAIFSQYPEGANILSALNNKVDKVDGKGLSTNDFTNTYKTKLDNAVILTDLNTKLEGFVPTTRTVNGKALSANIVVSQHRGNHTASVTYYVGDTVVYSNRVYSCITQHTSTSSFATASWTLIGYLASPSSSVELGLFSNTEKQKLAALPDNATLSSTYATKNEVGNKVSKETGKGLSTNDFTDAYKEQLERLGEGGEENVITEIQINGTKQEPTNKVVNITKSTLQTTLGDASTSAKGLMTTTQVTKLNGIATGATADSAIAITDIQGLFSTN